MHVLCCFIDVLEKCCNEKISGFFSPLIEMGWAHSPTRCWISPIDQVVIAQVDDNGFLSSSSLTGISSLLVTSQETFGVNQTLILAVKVSLRCTVEVG